MKRSAAIAAVVAALALAGVAWFLVAREGHQELAAPAAQQRQEAQRRTAREKLEAAGMVLPEPPAASANHPGRLHHPAVNYDRISVAGEEEPHRTADMSDKEMADLKARMQQRPSPEAISTGEDEKAARRAEAQQRKKMRAEGLKAPQRDRQRHSPGQVVREAQLDVEAERAEAGE